MRWGIAIALLLAAPEVLARFGPDLLRRRARAMFYPRSGLAREDVRRLSTMPGWTFDLVERPPRVEPVGLVRTGSSASPFLVLPEFDSLKNIIERF